MRIYLGLSPNFPKWWSNLLAEVEAEYGSPYLDKVEKKLKNYRATLLHDNYVKFKTKQDYVSCLLRYS